jgi:hypothetical protein
VLRSRDPSFIALENVMENRSGYLARCLWVVVFGASSFAGVAAETASTDTHDSATFRVPADHPTIQAAIDAAQDGDTVLVSPGTYHESLRIGGKNVRLVSEFDSTGNKDIVRKTILDGAKIDADGRVQVLNQIILVEPDAGPNTEIVGFTIRNGDDGISCQADVRIAHNYFTGNDDAIDYEGGGGLCEYNKFEKNTDDGVDYDDDCDATVVHNEIVDNEDDGIEIRFQPYRGKQLQLTIRDNIITGNGEDGIQIIDYPELSDRRVRIERNLIANNAMAGIGLMSDAISDEDYRGADVPEPIEIVNNTIAGNEFGLVGGDNLVAINNIIRGNKRLGMKKVDGGSVASHNLFWANGTDFDDASNVRDEHTLLADPQLDENHRPRAGSPCLGAGVATFATPKGVIVIEGSATAATTCDLGANTSKALSNE